MTDKGLEIPRCVPIFPLSEVVLFPRQVLPLHVFEPRYRTMIADLLAGERMLAVPLLKCGYETDYFTSHAPIHEVCGLGRIVAAEGLPDGKYNLLVRGEARVRLCGEQRGKPYRVAGVQLLQSRCTALKEEARELRRTLRGLLTDGLLSASDWQSSYLELFDAPIALGDLTDMLASGLPLVGELRQSLLAELDAAERARLLIEHIRTLGAVARSSRAGTQVAALHLN